MRGQTGDSDGLRSRPASGIPGAPGSLYQAAHVGGGPAGQGLAAGKVRFLPGLMTDQGYDTGPNAVDIRIRKITHQSKVPRFSGVFQQPVNQS